MAETSMLTREDEVRARFESDIAEHQMTIVRDVGLYRHLRCAKPDSWMYGFNVVTWPGYLYVGGDTEDYVFSRIPDMFDFFGDGTKYSRGINPPYWAEKLRSTGRLGFPEQYSADKLREHVTQWLAERCDELGTAEAESLREAVAEDILDREEMCDETAACFLVRDFEHAGHRIYEPEEWDLREYTHHFLWACWAIVWAIDKYNAAKAPGESRR